MILEDATQDVFEYYPSELTLKSHKLILVACELCGEFRITTKHDYHTFCLGCSRFLSDPVKGKKNPQWRGGPFKCICETCGNTFYIPENKIKKGNGKYCSYKCRGEGKKGENHFNYGKRGTETPNCKGGKKIASARHSAKRKELEYVLLRPLGEGEVGHHVTDEYVIGIPKSVHKSLSGYARRKHRIKVLEWLKDNNTHKYNLVLLVLKNEKESTT